MSEALTLTIYSPDRKLIDGVSVRVLNLFGSEGHIEVLPGHANMIGALETGQFSYETSNGDEHRFGVISTGFFEVRNQNVTVMAETLELSREIDPERARIAEEKARKAIEGAGPYNENFRKNELKLQRAMIRQQVAGKH